MRPKEEDGVDYIFVSKEKFESWIEKEELLEHALVYGEYKGILRSQIDRALANKQDVVLRLDVQGAATMRRLMPDAITIFLVSLATVTSRQHQVCQLCCPAERTGLQMFSTRHQCGNTTMWL